MTYRHYKEYAAISLRYLEYAQEFEPGSLGYEGNLAESLKYSALAERSKTWPEG